MRGGGGGGGGDDDDDGEAVRLLSADAHAAHTHAQTQTSGSSAAATRLHWAALVCIVLTIFFQSVATSGRQSTLYFYFSDAFQQSDAMSTFLTNGFMFVYSIIGPLGGVLSDRVLGNYWTQVVGTALWTVGGGVTVVATLPALVGDGTGLPLAIAGLVVVGVGYGVVNPIQSVFVGDQFDPRTQAAALRRSMSLYYFFCAAGNVLGESVAPVLHQQFGFLVLVIALAAVTLLGLVPLVAGARCYRRVPAKRRSCCAGAGASAAAHGSGKGAPSRSSAACTSSADVRALLRASALFAPLIVWWALYNQQGSTWVTQGDDMYTQLGTWNVPPDMMQSLNDVMVVVLVPLAELVYAASERRGRRITSFAKLVAGMVCAALAFGCATGVQYAIDAAPPQTVSMAWQLPQYFFISVAEVFVGVTGLQVAYAQSPRGMRGFITALWYITQALGNAVVSLTALVPGSDTHLAILFAANAGAMLVVTVPFAIVVRNMNDDPVDDDDDDDNVDGDDNDAGSGESHSSNSQYAPGAGSADAGAKRAADPASADASERDAYRWQQRPAPIHSETEIPPVLPGKTRIGWIGTGVMGAPMCEHLLKAGYDVTVFNRTERKARALAAFGAKVVHSAGEVARHSDVVVTMVGFPRDVRHLLLGHDGILHHMRPGGIFVDMTTSRPQLARQLYEACSDKGCFALDAPVSGGDVGARNATLTVMAGGRQRVLDAVRPMFEPLAKTITYFGPAGSGQHAKMVNQIMIANTMVGVVEGLLYAYKAGLDAQDIIDTLSAGAAANWSLTHYGPRINARNFQPGFVVEHFVKDMAIAIYEAEMMGLSLPGLSNVRQLYISLVNQGHGRKGTHALMLALEHMNNISHEPVDGAKKLTPEL